MIVPKRQKKTGLDALANASRPVSKFVKEFSSKHQGLFQKVLHLFEKVLSSFSAIIFGKLPQKLNYSSPLKAASSASLMIFSISIAERFKVSTTT